MPPEVDLAQLIMLEPDERLLGEDLDKLPAAMERPESFPESPARRRIVAVGATLTGISLLLGIALIAAGIGEAVSDAVVLAIAAIVVGVAFIATHWGWVHVAELTANKLEERRRGALLERRRRWLAEIEPYPHREVSTTTEPDGSIAIVTVRYRPVACGQKTFTFVRDEVARELHSGEEPAAEVAERAELLRRQAAADTEHERERYEVARDAYRQALLADADEQERLAAVRAVSEALSERINANLRDPPLVE